MGKEDFKENYVKWLEYYFPNLRFHQQYLNKVQNQHPLRPWGRGGDLFYREKMSLSLQSSALALLQGKTVYFAGIWKIDLIKEMKIRTGKDVVVLENTKDSVALKLKS